MANCVILACEIVVVMCQVVTTYYHFSTCLFLSLFGHWSSLVSCLLWWVGNVKMDNSCIFLVHFLDSLNFTLLFLYWMDGRGMDPLNILFRFRYTWEREREKKHLAYTKILKYKYCKSLVKNIKPGSLTHLWNCCQTLTSAIIKNILNWIKLNKVSCIYL